MYVTLSLATIMDERLRVLGSIDEVARVFVGMRDLNSLVDDVSGVYAVQVSRENGYFARRARN